MVKFIEFTLHLYYLKCKEIGIRKLLISNIFLSFLYHLPEHKLFVYVILSDRIFKNG